MHDSMSMTRLYVQFCICSTGEVISAQQELLVSRFPRTQQGRQVHMSGDDSEACTWEGWLWLCNAQTLKHTYTHSDSAMAMQGSQKGGEETEEK
uniref:Uncharacterized protein n=1 Tax=Oryza punctata TaxID=4537 RepID=A0A0E0KLI9_ORYPU